MTPKQRRAYEDYMISVHAARDAWETLRDESRAEGEAIGIAKGETIGEEKARRENALKMKADKMPVELIAKYTGLTAEEIEAL
jgi:predicted transposase YdaD